MTEQWADIAGFKGVYSVSDQGRVRRDARGPSTRPGFILSPSSKGGYLQVGLCQSGETSMRTIHRLVAAAFLGPCPAGHECNHISGDKADNRTENLEWVTHAENIHHSRTILKTPAGCQKLGRQEAAAIRWLYTTGNYSQAALATKFKVSTSAICDIVHGKTWRHIAAKRIRDPWFRGGKLTRDAVLAIRRLHKTGASMTAIAGRFDVSVSCVSLIINRKRWAHLPAIEVG